MNKKAAQTLAQAGSADALVAKLASQTELDRDFITRMYGPYPALYQRIFGDFLQIKLDQLEQLDACTGDNALQAILVHRFAGQLANLGFTQLATAARETESLLTAQSHLAQPCLVLLREALVGIDRCPEVLSGQ